MKKRLYLLISALILTCGSVVAQDYLGNPKWGVDSTARKKNVLTFNFFNDAYKAKDYNLATVYLRELIQESPKASMNLYIRGIDIYNSKVSLATTKAERHIFVDSILWIYDKRIEAFSDHGKFGAAYLRNAKALLYVSLMPSEREQVFQLFDEAIEGKHSYVSDLCVNYFQSMLEHFKLDDLTPEEVIENYERLLLLIKNNPCPKGPAAIKALDGMFATSGAANCESIETIYKPKYEADPENAELVKSILGLLSRGECSSDFYLTLLQKHYTVSPTPEIAVQLAFIFQEKKDFTKAMEYLKVGIDNEEDPILKANFLLQAAGMASSESKYRETVDFARQALELDPNNGLAYFFIGASYGSGSGSACSGFDGQTALWLAVDNLSRARQNLDADDPQQSAINQMIGNYSSNFPKTEETFMRNLEPGQSYTVQCGWISGSTTVRER